MLKFGNVNTESGRLIINLVILLFALFFSHFTHADLTPSRDFGYLNQLRTQSHLQPFNWNHELATAAQNHANYLTYNSRHGHYQQNGLALFTGNWVTDRAIFAHYPNRLVSENVTSKSGDNRFYNPIDSLMSAIYHRFGFLDFTKNEVGIAHQEGRMNSYVYVMGNSAISSLCKKPDFTGNGEYNYKICPDEKKRIEKSLVDKTKLETLLKHAKIVVWPPINSQQIPPVFFEESPDPLPHHSVSGYPVSIQFNPAYFKTAPKLTDFKLFKEASDKPLDTITVLNSKNDPNKIFSDFQHALFPTFRLDWNSSYTAKVNYINVDTQQRDSLSWTFKTKHYDRPIITVLPSTQSIQVEQGKHYILYFPPKNARDTHAGVSYREQNMRLKLNYIDKNTLNVYIERKGNAEITFHNKTIKLTTR